MRTASGLAMLLLVAILIAVGGAALKLLMDRQSMAAMIDDYGQTLTSMPVPPGPAAQAFASARQRAGSGDFVGAKSDLKRGVGLVAETAAPPAVPEGPLPEAPPRAPSPADLERAADALPEKVRPFFKDHPDLLRQVMMVRARAEGRVPRAEMEKQAERVMEAAAAGDEGKVKSVLEEIRASLGPAGRQSGRRPGGRMPGAGRMPGGGAMPPGGRPMPGGGPRGAGEARGQVQQWITQGRRILADARRAGADTREAAELINQAEQLLAQGNEPEAAEKMRAAMGEMRGLAANAQRRPGRVPRGGSRVARRPGSGRGGGGRPMAMPGILGTLLGHMQMESAAIVGAMEDIQNASVSLLEKNQAQVREILSSATSKLQAVGRGRAELNKELQEMQRAPREAPQGRRPRGPRSGQGFRQPAPEQPGGPFAATAAADAQRRVHDLLGRVLDEARALSSEEYEEGREEMIERFVTALMEPPEERLTLEPGQPPRPGGLGLPPLELPDEEPTGEAERARLRERVRERLRMLHEPYLMLATAEVEIEPVQRLLRQAREAFAADKLLDAGKSVNHASDLIWQLMQIHRADLQPGKGDESAGERPPVEAPEASGGGP